MSRIGFSAHLRKQLQDAPINAGKGLEFWVFRPWTSFLRSYIKNLLKKQG